VSRVFLKTIVSSKYELPYVLLNLYELENLCDEFWITEPNRTHTGEEKEYNFEALFDVHIRDRFPTARYIKMDISKEAQVWHESYPTDEILRYNEYLTRSSFIHYITEPADKDIIISVDGDEVICSSLRLKLLLLAMKYWPFKKPLAFLVTLKHFLFYINLYMSEYDFYSPSISHSKFYKDQLQPHWRGGGHRIWHPLGCHFSWMMTVQEMRNKILTYGHKDRLRHLASLDVLKSIKGGRYDLFEPNVRFGPIQLANYKSRKFPRSLIKIRQLLDKDLILNAEEFWR
jgi:Glycosyltransferase family 17